ncbi:hypothetical protein Acid345_4114 [Candidatus Koribacter versatilis Ellin345]|uniref:Uncharacterized protein n=1 Tax=Koribacter versatilis (strain Ellin345) TaxID=204669 RepID=Q1IJ36_KORVE|nr:hypothetical protein Acid345_4114 [Candidatus Koribacter versatilis Ellin345]
MNCQPWLDPHDFLGAIAGILIAFVQKPLVENEPVSAKSEPHFDLTVSTSQGIYANNVRRKLRHTYLAHIHGTHIGGSASELSLRCESFPAPHPLNNRFILAQMSPELALPPDSRGNHNAPRAGEEKETESSRNEPPTREFPPSTEAYSR